MNKLIRLCCCFFATRGYVSTASSAADIGVPVGITSASLGWSFLVGIEFQKITFKNNEKREKETIRLFW